jgi:hypothetical protein
VQGQDDQRNGTQKNDLRLRRWKKNDDYQGYASFTSAQALKIFVEKYL